MSKPIVGIPMRNNYARNDGILYWNRTYANAITQAGGIPLPIPFLADTADLMAAYEIIDGLLLSGGGDVAARFYDIEKSDLITYVDEERDEIEMLMTQWAMRDEMPILAICRGIQMLNVAAGGTLIPDIPTCISGSLRHATPSSIPRDHHAHLVEVAPQSLLYTALGCDQADADGAIRVNSLHHQAIDIVGQGLRVVACATDGIIEAIEPDQRNGHFCLGVQWHPEEMVLSSLPMRRLFTTFVQSCAE